MDTRSSWSGRSIFADSSSIQNSQNSGYEESITSEDDEMPTLRHLSDYRSAPTHVCAELTHEPQAVVPLRPVDSFRSSSRSLHGAQSESNEVRRRSPNRSPTRKVLTPCPDSRREDLTREFGRLNELPTGIHDGLRFAEPSINSQGDTNGQSFDDFDFENKATGNADQPSHIDSSQDEMLHAIYYPAPIPKQLKRPPILSSRNKDQTQDSGASSKPRKRSSQIGIDSMTTPIPNWEPVPLTDEVTFSMEDCDSDMESVLDNVSDRATIMSGEELRSDDNEDDEDEQSNKKRPGKRRSWFESAWGKLIGKDGNVDGEREYDDENQSMAEDDLAFLKYDHDKIQQHSGMFRVGGAYDSIVPHRGNRTSLVEEIQIRKLGRKLQHQTLLNESHGFEQQRLEEKNNHAHPLDITSHPTLLQMQHYADTEYKNRVGWHTRTLNPGGSQGTNETLAERRARLRAQKKLTGQDNSTQETLAQRRIRLRGLRESIRPAKPALDLEDEHDSDSGKPQSFIEGCKSLDSTNLSHSDIDSTVTA